jgi:4-hydroxybenzoate polyprenyltransferase
MQVAAHQALAPERLPFREDVLAYLRGEKARGRELVLATAAPRPYADAVAGHLGLFDAVLATTADRNLKGAAKRDAIVDHAAGRAFAYVGDSAADAPIWEAAETAVFVSAPRALVAAARREGKCELVISERGSAARAFMKQMRPHQWAKNLLVLVPLFTAHLYFEPAALGAAVLAFLLFSLCASGVYFLNDLLDLEADREHRSKRHRPLASGQLSIGAGMAGAVLLPTAAVVAGLALLPPAFTAILVFYYLLTTLYSFYLKRISTADVMVLALLYTVRIAAGASAIAVTLSPWLLAFSVFFFVNLAYLKRYIEIAEAGDAEAIRGRGYTGTDAEAVFTLGTGAATTSALVFALFLSGDEVKQTYAYPEFLWLVPFLLLYWTHRLWIGGRRRKIHDDPIVFAIKDRVSLAVAGMILVLMVLAHHLP